jgi:hypothetical protein
MLSFYSSISYMSCRRLWSVHRDELSRFGSSSKAIPKVKNCVTIRDTLSDL